MGKNNRQRRLDKKRNNARRLKARRQMSAEKGPKTLGPALRQIPNPFEGLNEAEHKQAINEIAKNSEKIYQESLAKIKEVLLRHHPLSLLSVLATHGLTAPVGAKGIQKKDSDFTIYQSHIEILHALALQVKHDWSQKKPFGPDVIQHTWDALVNLMRAHGYRDLAQGIEEKSEEGKAVWMLQHSIRGSTQMVRNWGYFSQVKSISRELYSHFDILLEEKYGFTASQIIALFELLIDETENALSTRFRSLKELYKLKNKSELVFKYHEMIGVPRDDALQFIRKINIGSIPFKSLFMILMSHYDLRLYKIYQFSSKILAEKLGVNENVVKSILDSFSYQWGDLESYETEYLYLSNPVWLRPLIKLEANDYFCPIPQLFFSFIIPSLDRLMEETDQAALRARRSNYLEDKIVEIINKRFPEANTVSGIKWKHDGVEYETDLITFIDSHAVIVEAKSGKISEPALRGAPARLRRHVEEVLVAPNIQSRRLKERLEELIANPSTDDDIRNKLPVDLINIHEIIRVSVSLEYFGTVQSNVAQLKQTGWLSDDFEACPTLSLSDFETLFDFLEHPVQIIHYLERRQELEGVMGYMGDELDLMGLYIGTLFNFGDINKEMEFVLTGMSSPLDKYYNSKDAGVVLPKPLPKVSPHISGILSQLEKRETPRWTEIGVILHRFSPDDQVKLTSMIKYLIKNVQRNWMVHDHKNTVILVPSENSKYALCYVIYNNHNQERRLEFIQNAATSGLKKNNVKQCLVIAKNIDSVDVHYNFIGLFE